MHEVLTLHIGQCGNQIGNEFWKRIGNEHENGEGKPEKFFYPGKVPRAIFIDSEPRVVNKQFKNNYFIANDGIGAGNNYGVGYQIGKECSEDILDLINRHVEACDGLESIIFMHSTAGGTGSGFGSYLSDSLRDIYGSKKLMISFAVLPTNKESSEVVIQPYNTILTLNKLYRNMDSVILMDNYALNKQSLASNLINTTFPVGNISQTYESLNDVAGDVISNFTSSLRFPSYMFNTMSSITSVLSPLPSFKFIVPSYIKSNSSLSEIMHNLIKTKTMLCEYEDSTLYSSFSVMNNICRDLHSSKNVLNISRLTQPKINFHGLPFYLFNLNHSKSSIGLNNSTCVRTIFSKIAKQFDRLRSKSAFMDIYKKHGCDEEVFDQARENVSEIISSYELAEEKTTK